MKTNFPPHLIFIRKKEEKKHENICHSANEK